MADNEQRRQATICLLRISPSAAPASRGRSFLA